MERIIEHLIFIEQNIEKTMNHLDSRGLSNIQYFCVGLLQRLRQCAAAVRALLKDINTQPHLEFGCGVILRSGLLDALIVLNLYKIVRENEASLKSEPEKEQIVGDFCDTCLTDGLSNTVKYIQVAKNVGILTQGEMETTFKNLTESYSHFFDDYKNDGSAPTLRNKKFFAPEKLFIQLANTKDMKELSKIYDSYLFFSKYDHFGILYYELSKQTFQEQLTRISESVEIMVSSSSILHAVLRMHSTGDEVLIIQSNVASQYLFDKLVKKRSGNTVSQNLY